MNFRSLVLGLLVFSILSPGSSAWAGAPMKFKVKDVEELSFSKVLQELQTQGAIVIPAGWAGVWDTIDTVYTCPDEFFFADRSVDTLCTGDVVDMDIGQEGVTVDCTGSTYDDDSVNINCTLSGEFAPCTIVSGNISLVGSRNGDDANVVFNYNVDLTGGLFCFDLCQIGNTTQHRIAPEPPSCATPVAPTTWGMIKALYR